VAAILTTFSLRSIFSHDVKGRGSEQQLTLPALSGARAGKNLRSPLFCRATAGQGAMAAGEFVDSGFECEGPPQSRQCSDWAACQRSLKLKAREINTFSELKRSAPRLLSRLLSCSATSIASATSIGVGQEGPQPRRGSANDWPFDFGDCHIRYPAASAQPRS
jgi:hypothetical protein